MQIGEFSPGDNDDDEDDNDDDYDIVHRTRHD
jgi:hypothetical protein